MRSRRPALLLCGLLSGVLLPSTVAHAVPGAKQYGNQAPRPPASHEELARDLSSEDKPTRLLAARELRRRVKAADRAARSRPGSIHELEGRADLGALTRLVVPPCEGLLTVAGVGPACADMLGRLEEPSSCAPLAAAMASESRGNARAAARARARLGPICAGAE